MNQISPLQSAQQKLFHHPLYAKIRRKEDVTTFMKYHIFCVWDFMTLLKSLQKRFCPIEVPWYPSKKTSRQTQRLIYQIVLGEETDLDQENNVLSHFELYLKSMEELNVDSSMIRDFLKFQELTKLPHAVKNFVSFHLNLALNGKDEEVLGVFFHSREDVIPDMFQRVIDAGGITHAPTLTYYLKRHIELDSGEHSHLASQALEQICGGDQIKVARSQKAAIEAIELRIRLWDTVLQDLTHPTTSKLHSHI